jgi:acetoacetyl-CoA synthetase
MASLRRASRLPALEPGIGSSRSQLGSFMRFCETRTGEHFSDHAGFHDFSVVQSERFWSLFLEWSQLAHEGSSVPVRTSASCELARFFPDLRLSYTENLLGLDSPDDAARGALIAHSAYGQPVRLTRGELRSRVLSVARHLRELGVGPGDRIVAVAGNSAEAVIGALATASIGAVFSSAAPEMGVPAVLSRFAQLEPALLMCNAMASGTTGLRPMKEHIEAVTGGLPTLRAVVVLDDGPPPARLGLPTVRLADMLDDPQAEAEEWSRLPFNHPLFVLFTSGTTGQPKCLLHGAGGTLLEHVKEHRLHVALRPGERLFFHTSAAWMMWNWQLSALASGAELVLYDGPIRDAETLWRLVRTEEVNVFGTSPPYLQLCEDAGCRPGPLPQLRAILSTGSILHDWQYDWVDEQLGPVAVQSISGGTDIIGCFVLGNPDLPVRRGLIPCRSLGLDVQAVTGDGAVVHGAVGELVCRNPFPSRPLGFFGDDGTQFHAAYFARNRGVWTHGDLIEFDPDGQARMHGRSDGILNVRGARIGPVEIYRALHGVDELVESVAVELEQPDGERAIALLVVLRAPCKLDRPLVVKIRREIATNASPSHMPALIAQVEELPVTHSGKRSERAARDTVNGRPVGNPQALANPESLAGIRAAVSAVLERQREFDAVAGRSDDAPTESRVIEIWEALLGVAVGPNDNFFELGGTSLLAVRLLQAIHERIGVELPPAVFLYAQTPAQLVTLIDGPIDQRAPILVPMRGGTSDRSLFVVHAMGGDVLHVRPLALALDTGRPVYGLQARGMDPRYEPQTSVEEMAATYIDVIRLVQPNGPYAIAGYSMGGLVAYEMARRLSAAGERVEMLALIDAYVNPVCLPTPARWWFQVGRPLRYLRYVIGEPHVRIPEVAHNLRRRIARRHLGQSWEPDLPRTPRFAALERIGWQAVTAYRPGPYEGTATLFLARTRYPSYCNPAGAWRRCVRGGLTVKRMTGDHGALVAEGSAHRVAGQLSALLRESEPAAC